MLLFLVFGCEKDEPLDNVATSVQDKGYVVKTVYKKETRANTALFELIQNQTPNQQNTQGRPVESSDGNIVFNDEYAKYIEYDDFHSYTFVVTNTPRGKGLENVVFLSQNDGGYHIFLMSYDLTEAEIEKIAGHEPFDLEPQNVEITELGRGYLPIETEAETETETNLLTCVWVAYTYCSYGNHDHGIEDDGSACPGFSVGVDRVCESSGGGGGIPHYEPPSYNPTSNGGGAGNNGMSILVAIETTRLEDLLACLAAPIPYGEDPLLSPTVLAWLEEDADDNGLPDNYLDVIRDLANFVSQNNCSPEAAAFGALAAEALYEGGEVDYVNEVILDSTFLNNQKANCVYEKLKGLSNTIFNDIIDGHFGSSKNAILKFEVGNFPPQLSNRDALTYTNYDSNNPNPSSDNSITIRLNSTFVSNASTIEIALAIIHESIHAELIDRCISLGIIESINSIGMVTFTGDPNNYDLSAVIFNLMVLHYANPGPNPNPNWNHDLFTV
ncbi:MAG TPA: hypothetical protein VFM65_06650, partial [Flavobacteriaceae bacterium]|nr:hypothetical protein [Flavobacteriaceae bacterium]